MYREHTTNGWPADPWKIKIIEWKPNILYAFFFAFFVVFAVFLAVVFFLATNEDFSEQTVAVVSSDKRNRCIWPIINKYLRNNSMYANCD